MVFIDGNERRTTMPVGFSIYLLETSDGKLYLHPQDSLYVYLPVDMKSRFKEDAQALYEDEMGMRAVWPQDFLYALDRFHDLFIERSPKLVARWQNDGRVILHNAPREDNVWYLKGLV
jgi:hypothetical protein